MCTIVSLLRARCSHHVVCVHQRRWQRSFAASTFVSVVSLPVSPFIQRVMHVPELLILDLTTLPKPEATMGTNEQNE